MYKFQDNSELECEDVLVHTDIVDSVSHNMPDEEMLYDLAEFYKVFADSTRIKMLYALSILNVCMRYC